MDALQNILRLFPAALAAGALVSTAGAVLGVFVILRRMVFVTAVLAQIAACGVAVGMLLDLPPTLAATAFCLLTVGLLARDWEARGLPREAVLGVLFVFASCLGILLVANSPFGRREVDKLLYGDLILTSWTGVIMVTAVTLPAMVFELACLRPLLCVFLDRDAARVDGLAVKRWEFAWLLALGLLVSVASRVVGSLLIFAYLVVPPTAALLCSRRLQTVLFLAAGMGLTATAGGIWLSYLWQWPTNHTIGALCCLWLIPALLRRGWQSRG